MYKDNFIRFYWVESERIFSFAGGVWRMYTRSQLSKRTGIGFDALRYYERFGLLPLPARGANRYRQYDEDAEERLLFIQQAKKCGFTLNEIKQTFDLLTHPQSCSISSDEVIDMKIQDLDDKIAQLSKMKGLLQTVKESLREKCGREILTFRINDPAI
jgi:MerR family transcriptional regulator, Zn(II)-responsive regulator of zntA